MPPIFNIPKNRTAVALYILLVIALSGIAFQNLAHHPLNAQGDDQETLHDTRLMARDVSALFSPKRLAPVRPTMDLIVLAGYRLWGDRAGGFHLLLVGLHAIASLLLVWALRRLGIDREWAFLTGLLFLLNVSHFRSVQWFICIGYVLALIGALLCLLGISAYLHTDAETRRQGDVLLSEALQAAGKNIGQMRYGGALAFQNLAAYYRKTGHPAEAITLYERALQLYPDYAQALFNLGETLFAQGRNNEARNAFQKAVRIDPDYAARVPEPFRQQP